MKRWQGLLMGFGVLLLSLSSVGAEDRVIMRRADVGEDRAFFETLLKDAQNRSPGEEFTMENFYIGRFDVNDDGVPELFVLYSQGYFCGSAGCETPVFQLQGGQWVEIADVAGDFAAWKSGNTMGPIDYLYVIAEDERIDGYRTLRGREAGVRWGKDKYTGEDGYNSFCISERCKADLGG